MPIKNTTPPATTTTTLLSKVSPEVLEVITAPTTVVKAVVAARASAAATKATTPAPAPITAPVTPSLPATTKPVTAPAAAPATPAAAPADATEDHFERGSLNKYAEAVAIATAQRAILFPLEAMTTRRMLGDSSNANVYRGVGTSIATGVAGKAGSLISNKTIRDTLEKNDVPNATLLAGIGAGLAETAMNPLNVISQQAKMVPGNELYPSLKAIPLKSYYNGGNALLIRNITSAGLWYHGNAVVRNENDSVPVEAAKAVGVGVVSSAGSWPARLLQAQRIGVNGVSPSYKEIITQATKDGVVKGLKLNALFPFGMLRVVIGCAVLGPLMNRFNEK